MQRLEARIADLAGQLDLIARRPAPAQDQGLSARIEALADRIEDLSHERAALRLEERIEQLSLMLEQSHHAAPAMAGGDALADYLSDISRKIDALDQGSVNGELAERLDALARRIDNLDAPVGSPFQEDRFSHIEGRLSAIADRLDATRTAPAGALSKRDRMPGGSWAGALWTFVPGSSLTAAALMWRTASPPGMT